MTTLRAQLDDLATQFANGVLAAIRGASIEDLLAESGSRRLASRAVSTGAARPAARGRGGRLARRSAEDIEGVIERIVGVVKQSPKGLRAEQIRTKLGMMAKEMPRPLKEAVASGRLSKSGQKRATTYTAKAGGASRRAAKPARKARKK